MMYLYCLNDRLDTEEQWQSLGCCDKEDTCANDHHYLLLEILSIFHKRLIHNIIYLTKQAQETNWKQKFEKLQNENICLTNLNVASNGNFPILAFGDYNENGENSHQIEAINVCPFVKDEE